MSLDHLQLRTTTASDAGRVGASTSCALLYRRGEEPEISRNPEVSERNGMNDEW